MEKVAAEKIEAEPEEKRKERMKKEYLLILTAFRHLVNSLEDSAEAWQVMEEIITLRTASLYSCILEGLKLDFDRALELLRNHNDFITIQEKEQRDILIAAIDNLVDFAAAEQFAMMNDVRKVAAGTGNKDYEKICEKYNLTYAETENEEALYAAGIAGWWLNQSSEALITYMTQGDERVRESHQVLEGLTFPKNAFPAGLIPPIDWRCRCYLLSDGNEAYVQASIKTDHLKKVNPVFRESLAKKGRIFSESHPYFTSAFRKNRKIQTIIQKLKDKLLCKR